MQTQTFRLFNVHFAKSCDQDSAKSLQSHILHYTDCHIVIERDVGRVDFESGPGLLGAVEYYETAFMSVMHSRVLFELTRRWLKR